MYKLVFITSIAILFSSCSYHTVDGNSAQQIQVKSNEKFRINLPENHATGYTWQLNDTYDATIIDHINTVWEGNSNGVFFYFKSAKAGTTILNFTSRKYDDVNSIKEITITVSGT
jgi:predicted secreted protein